MKHLVSEVLGQDGGLYFFIAESASLVPKIAVVFVNRPLSLHGTNWSSQTVEKASNVELNFIASNINSIL